jgi:hypothetical protein
MGAVGSPEKAVNVWQAKWYKIQDVSIFIVNVAITSDGIQFYFAHEDLVSEQAALHCAITSWHSGNNWLQIFGRQPVRLSFFVIFLNVTNQYTKMH